MSLERARRAAALGLLLLASLLLTGCLEQLVTTRIPSGATRNFLFFLTHGQQDNAMAYWAPGHVPPDARAQVAQAVTALKPYTVTVQKADVQSQTDGSAIVTLEGQAARTAAVPTGTPQPILRAHLMEIGPGWRLLDFRLLCCPPP